MNMKKRIIISINPEHVENILNGTKKYEYRKIAAKQDVSSIIIYETTPIKKIVAEAEIEEMIMLPPEELWQRTKQFSGISKDFFDKYFYDRKVACAYKLGKVKKYKQPRSLIYYGLKNAPQSFVYV